MIINWPLKHLSLKYTEVLSVLFSFHQLYIFEFIVSFHDMFVECLKEHS